MAIPKRRKKWPASKDVVKVRLAQRKKAAKLFSGSLDYTPMISGMLASICCDVAESSEAEKREFLNVVSEVVRSTVVYSTKET